MMKRRSSRARQTCWQTEGEQRANAQDAGERGEPTRASVSAALLMAAVQQRPRAHEGVAERATQRERGAEAVRSLNAESWRT
jgi:hypothetical protein